MSRTIRAPGAFVTGPHGEHEVVLVEDAESAEDRIYEIRHRSEGGSKVAVLGSEIISLLEWWRDESLRAGQDAEEDEDGDG